MKDYSEPAFPSDSNTYGPVLGISIRDYFAAQALIMVSAGNNQEDLATWDYCHFAEHAYRMADAMLLERAK